MTDLVPFGKYRGKPVEALAADQQYVDWLLNQNWFRGKYENLYTIIINNFAEPSETPEHNALQVKFLDDKFCIKCVEVAYPDKGFVESYNRKIDAERPFVKEHSLPALLDINNTIVSKSDMTCSFEIAGFDVIISLTKTIKERNYSNEMRYWIEIKPDIGDDYPAILRKMRSIHKYNGSPILLLERYNGIGATREQFIEIFRRASIPVVFLSDIL